jgi:hypothetical protein
MHWITLKYTTNTMKYTINTPNCIEKHSSSLVSFKIHLFTIKNTFKYFNIHSNTFQIHCNTFITFLWCTLEYIYHILICFHTRWIRTSLSYYCTIFQNCQGASLSPKTQQWLNFSHCCFGHVAVRRRCDTSFWKFYGK